MKPDEWLAAKGFKEIEGTGGYFVPEVLHVNKKGAKFAICRFVGRKLRKRSVYMRGVDVIKVREKYQELMKAKGD